MRFHVEQHIGFDADATARCFTDPELYAGFAALPKVAVPEVLDRVVDGDVVTMRIRHRFAGDLNKAVRAVIDPDKLTWVDESVHHLAERHVLFVLHPDAYADRFRCHGEYRIEPTPTGCRRVASVEVQVSAPLVGRAVEGAIASGLREHLADETEVIEEYLRRHVAGGAGGGVAGGAQ